MDKIVQKADDEKMRPSDKSTGGRIYGHFLVNRLFFLGTVY